MGSPVSAQDFAGLVLGLLAERQPCRAPWRWGGQQWSVIWSVVWLDRASDARASTISTATASTAVDRVHKSLVGGCAGDRGLRRSGRLC